ncbi:hypothetical protein N7527_008044 [Penicillium freii]|nr:hypothetical protein N7527_008044 [Penicillium freii]
MCGLVHEAYNANYLIWLKLEGRTRNMLTWTQGNMLKTGRCDAGLGTHDTPTGQKVTSHFLQLPLQASSTSPSSFNESSELGIHIPDTTESAERGERPSPPSNVPSGAASPGGYYIRALLRDRGG